nr:hypothetical protein [Amycolatopsis palatopharyngis]
MTDHDDVAGVQLIEQFGDQARGVLGSVARLGLGRSAVAEQVDADDPVAGQQRDHPVEPGRGEQEAVQHHDRTALCRSVFADVQVQSTDRDEAVSERAGRVHRSRARARPACRPEKMQPPTKVPSSAL